MNLISMILAIAMAGFGVLGLVVGIVKGFTKVKSWALEFMIASILTVAIGNLIRSNLPSVENQAYIILALAATLTVSLMMLCSRMRASIAKSIDKYQRRMYYLDFENSQIKENEIVDAIYVNDNKRYNKLTKPNKKYKRGGWGVVDRVFGGITLAVKGVVMTLIFACTLLTIVDLSTLTTIPNFQEPLTVVTEYFAGGQWQYFKEFIFDFALIGLLFAVIRNGYNGGLITSLWGLVIFVIVVLAAYLGWLMSGTELFAGAVTGLTTSMSGIYGMANGFIGGDLQTTISRIIITVGIFLVELVFIIILSILVPNLIHAARRGAAFRTIDGVMGAAFSAIVLLVVMWVLGGILQTLHDLTFMELLNTYFEQSRFATYFYGQNLLLVVSPNLFDAIPLRRMLAGEGFGF